MKPCKRGHTNGRNKHGHCIDCHRMTGTAWMAARPEKRRAWISAYITANREKWRENSARWNAMNPEKRRAINAKRRSMRFLQRCVCCTDARIELLYLAAKPWGAAAEVDHRVPLVLGGKHCARNLVLLPTAAHRQKTQADVRAIADAKRRSQLLRRWRAI
jgi:hypothetical protein